MKSWPTYRFAEIIEYHKQYTSIEPWHCIFPNRLFNILPFHKSPIIPTIPTDTRSHWTTYRFEHLFIQSNNLPLLSIENKILHTLKATSTRYYKYKSPSWHNNKKEINK